MSRGACVIAAGLLALGVGCRDREEAMPAEGSSSGGEESTTAEADLPASDPCGASALPPPFCHERIELPFPGSQDQTPLATAGRDGWRLLGLRQAGGGPGALVLSLVDVESMTAAVSKDVVVSGIGGGLVFGDFDGDGSDDLATIDAEISSFRQPDLEAWAPIPPEPVGTVPAYNSPTVVFDVDRDGTDELLPHAAEGVFHLWRLEGDTWTLAEQIDSPLCDLPYRPAKADLDGDGYDEVVYAPIQRCLGPDGATDQLLILRGGSGASVPTMDLVEVGGWAPYHTAGDFDGDGRDDVLLLAAWDTVAVFGGEADGSLSGPSVHAFADPLGPDDWLPEPVPGDLDGDGDDELVFAFSWNDQRGIALMDFDGGELSVTTYDNNESAPRLFDVNDDGRADLLVHDDDDDRDWLYVSLTPG